jgi:hypothetical protein
MRTFVIVAIVAIFVSAFMGITQALRARDAKRFVDYCAEPLLKMQGQGVEVIFVGPQVAAGQRAILRMSPAELAGHVCVTP